MSKRFSKDTRSYTFDQLEKAIDAVQKSNLSISKSAREFTIPRKTLDDHVKKALKSRPGPDREMSVEEEDAVVNYAKYLANRGFPMTRSILRQFVLAVVRRSNRESKFNLQTGPSNKWFRGFLSRHRELTEREPESQDRSRHRMSNPAVMQQYFMLLKDTVDRLGLKPSQIFNCDETGWSGKEKCRRRVITVKGNHSYQQSVLASGHVTAHLCICADGRVLPTFLIFEKCFPHVAYKDGVPADWLFGHSESGYMDGELFLSWFEKVFIPNCGSARPVLLIMDNHDSHTTLPVIELARQHDIELLGLPPHTTHLLQPLDVSINGPLKAKFSSTSVHLGHLNKNQIINKAKFPSVLSHTLDELCSPVRIKEAFKKTGISPWNPDAIDKSQLVDSHKVTTKTINGNDGTTDKNEVSSSATGICTACGTFLGQNPLVTEGLIPPNLSDIFLPVPCKPQTKRRKLVTEARVITSDEHLQQLKDKEEGERKRKEENVKRKAEREEKRKSRSISKRTKGKGKALKRGNKDKVREEDYICKLCSTNDRGVFEDTMWIGCDMCDDWVHPECVGIEEAHREDVEYICPDCKEE